MLFATATAVHGQAVVAGADAFPLQVRADQYQVEVDTGWAGGSGNVRVEYRGMVLEADTLRINLQNKDFEATGNIFFYSLAGPDTGSLGNDFFWRGEALQGNLDRREFRTVSSSGRFDEVFLVAGAGQFEQSGDAVFRNVQVSTCDYLHEGHAHFRLEAREVVYKSASKRLIARHAVYKIGNLPVFYWPYVAWDTDGEKGGNVKYRIGYRDDWGAFLTVARRWRLWPGAQTELWTDLRSKRGVGVGSETRFEAAGSETKLHLYGMSDLDPPEDADGMNRRFDSDSSRYRALVQHRSEPADKLSLRLTVDKLSDIDMLEEWYRREYEDYRQPKSFGDLRYDHERFTLSLGARLRLNDFYTVSEKAPELRLEMPRQRLFDWPFFYQSSTSLAYLRMKWRDFDQQEWWPPGQEANYLQHADYETVRLDTVQMLYLPTTVGDYLQMVPRAGLRLTYYGATSRREVGDAELQEMFRLDDADLDLPTNNLSLYDTSGGDALRLAGEIGLEVSSKMVRVWDHLRSDFWNVDGLRHVVQPYANYTVVSDPTVDREELLYFDEVDRLRGENFVRLGAEQRLQTRRESRGRQTIYTLARVDTYADFHLDRGDGRKTMGDFVTRFKVNSRERLSFWGLLLVDMHATDMRRFELGGSATPFDPLRVDLSYIFRDQHRRPPITNFGSSLADYTGDNITAAEFSDTHAIHLGLNIQVNDKLSLVANYLYDLEEGQLARHMYHLTRDLHCWVGSLFFGDDYGDFVIGFALHLKAFPDIAIEADLF